MASGPVIELSGVYRPFGVLMATSVASIGDEASLPAMEEAFRSVRRVGMKREGETG
ncbi:MAG: hypothetical protein OEW32_17160 [Nitrospira sp.]|jgi:hypothetical protein|nr:hypothetical protein [Nitrospira sp.]